MPGFGAAQHRLVSVIIPTMNEPLIESLVEAVHDRLSFVDHETIVVDKSDIPLKLRSARVVLQKSTGLGRAILEGLEASRGQYIAVMDGDFSHGPEDLALMVRKIEGLDFIIGSRYAPGGKNLDAPLRRLVSRAFNLVARLILQLKFSDPMSGLIVAKVDLFRRIRPNPIGYKINLELIYRATSLGFEGAEAPVTFRPRRSGKSKAGVSEAIRTAAYILALRLR